MKIVSKSIIKSTKQKGRIRSTRFRFRIMIVRRVRLRMTGHSFAYQTFLTNHCTYVCQPSWTTPKIRTNRLPDPNTQTLGTHCSRYLREQTPPTTRPATTDKIHACGLRFSGERRGFRCDWLAPGKGAGLVFEGGVFCLAQSSRMFLLG